MTRSLLFSTILLLGVRKSIKLRLPLLLPTFHFRLTNTHPFQFQQGRRTLLCSTSTQIQAQQHYYYSSKSRSRGSMGKEVIPTEGPVVGSGSSPPGSPAGEDEKLRKSSVTSETKMQPNKDKEKERFEFPKSDDPIYQNPECFMTPEEILQNHGYFAELHQVESEDGYIVSLLRLPYGQTLEKPSEKDTESQKKNKRPAILFVHGFGMNGISWVFNKEENVLAYQLANQGFDVWLYNARGAEKSSNTHVSLSNKSKRYWDFSWHEMGAQDIPSVINHILHTTGEEGIFYVGHSMGCAQLFVAASTNPEIASKIKLMIAYAPAVYIRHARSFLIRKAHILPSGIFNLIYHGELYSDRIYNTVRTLLPWVRLKRDKGMKYASWWTLYVLNLVNGTNIEQVYFPMLPLAATHLPSVSSLKSYHHFSQIHRSGVFHQFDYGRRKNLKTYGTEEPPKYDFSKSTFPVAVFGAKNDYCMSTEDVEKLAGELPNLKLLHIMEQPTWNHTDFYLGKDCGKFVNPIVLGLISEYL